jgi:hypothetical protein
MQKSLDMIALRLKLSYECPLELISNAFLPLYQYRFENNNVTMVNRCSIFELKHL